MNFDEVNTDFHEFSKFRDFFRRGQTGHGVRLYPRPGSEIKAALIICHPELAKDLTPHQPALFHHSPFSKLTAPHNEPPVPITCRLNLTSGSPREILRKLPMNLPVGDRRSAPTARPNTSLGQRPTAIKLSLEALVTRARSQAPAWECSIPGGSRLLPGLQKHSAPERNGRL